MTWSVDFESLRTRDGLLHGWGRLRGAGTVPARAWLEIRGRDGEPASRIPSVLGKQRDAGGALEVEVVFYGPLKAPISEQSVCAVVLELAGGLQARLPSPQPQAAGPAKGLAGVLALPWKHYFLRGLQLLRYGEVGPLLRKMGRMTQAMIAAGRSVPSLLKLAGRSGKPLALVIDHDLGGGANLFRNGLLKKLEAEGYAPVLLTAQHGMLAYELQTSERGRLGMAHERSLDALFAALPQARIARVVFNNIVSFPDPVGFVKALAAYLEGARVEQFLFLLHDYYCVCPAWLLLNHEGRYCGVPDAAACAACLPRNTTPFLEFSSTLDIPVWRAEWRGLLRQAHEIRCFSEESKKILLKAHPGLDREKVSVVPHKLEHVRLAATRLQDRGAPVVGIIGNIVHAKGSAVIRQLARHIRDTGSPVRLVVIGTLEFEPDREIVTVTGPYRPEQLAGLVQTHGVNVGFFPSIWPETFSYVTQEMIEMELPVLAFDLGAPMERVRAYRRGMIAASDHPADILAAAQSLYQAHVRHG